MAKQTPGLLDKLKPQVAQLNKAAVIAVVAGVLIILLYVMFSAFEGAAERQASESTQPVSIAKQSDNDSATPQALAHLPRSYQDAGAINQMLSRTHPHTTPLPASVQREIAQLRAQQAALHSQLQAMKSQPIKPTYVAPMADRQAMSSAIFFAGGAPRHQSATSKKSALSAKTKATSGTHSGAQQSKYAKQNMQQQKLSFMSGKVDKTIYNKNNIQTPVSKYEVMAGTVISAELKTEINSNNPGIITAIVTQNVYNSVDGQYLLIPKGSTLLGEYNSKVAFGQYQLQAKFLRLIRPDGTSILLPNQPGINGMGESGFSDEVDNHWGKIIGAAALSAIFNIPAIIATNQMNSTYNQSCSGDNCIISPSVGSTVGASALQGVGQTASQVGSQLTQRSLNIQPTIIIHANYPFSVMVTKDVVIPPYHSSMNNIPETDGVVS